MQAVADCTVADAPVLDDAVVRRYSDWGRGVPILPVTGRSVWDWAVEDWTVGVGCGLWRMGPWTVEDGVVGDGAMENDFTLQDEAEVTPEWACSRPVSHRCRCGGIQCRSGLEVNGSFCD